MTSQGQGDAQYGACRLVRGGGLEYGDRLIEAAEVSQGGPVLSGKTSMPGLIETGRVATSAFSTVAAAARVLGLPLDELLTPVAVPAEDLSVVTWATRTGGRFIAATSGKA
jgi:hypothetical protein